MLKTGFRVSYIVIASDQWERGNLASYTRDCFVVSLLAMTLYLMRLYQENFFILTAHTLYSGIFAVGSSLSMVRRFTAASLK